MLDIKRRAREISGIDANNIPESITNSTEPVILKSLVSHWPMVQVGQNSTSELIAYLKSNYNGNSTIVSKLSPDKNGRLFYNQSLTELDYQSFKGRIDETLDAIEVGLEHDSPDGYYIASNVIHTHFPKLRECNDLKFARDESALLDPATVSIWLGTKTVASCHYDAQDNIACCVAGKRQFILFPPDQVENLYPGPLEPTPGGQVISLVDFERPDFDCYPKFAVALEHAQVAELEPGDALFLPSMWWHHVQAKSSFNVLVNYWWSDMPAYITSGVSALYAAMLGIRDRPKHELMAWKSLFDYYIFDGPDPSSHFLPEEAKGMLAPLDETSARKLRAHLLNRLNR